MSSTKEPLLSADGGTAAAAQPPTAAATGSNAAGSGGGSSGGRPIAPPLVTNDAAAAVAAAAGSPGATLVSPLSSLFSPMNDSASRSSNLLSRSSIAQRSQMWGDLTTEQPHGHTHAHGQSHHKPHSSHATSETAGASTDGRRRNNSSHATTKSLAPVSESGTLQRRISEPDTSTGAAAAPKPTAAHTGWGHLASVVRRASGTANPNAAPTATAATADNKSDASAARFATVSAADSNHQTTGSVQQSSHPPERFLSEGANGNQLLNSQSSMKYSSVGSDSGAGGGGFGGLPTTQQQINSARNIEIAATYVLDGIHGRQIGYLIDPDSLSRYRLYHSTPWRVLFLVAAIVHMALVLFEDPSSLTPMSQYPNAPRIVMAFEFIIFAVYAADLALLYACFGMKRFRNLWPLLRLLILGLMVGDTIWYIGTGFTSFHLSRAFRPLMLICRLRNVRKMLSGCVVTSFRIYGVFLLLAFHIVFFGLMGYLLFVNATDITYFSELHLGMYYLFLLATCFPFNLTLMLPYWELTRWSGLFFLSFVLIGNLGIFKLIIAVSFKTYKLYIRHKLEDRLSKRRIALTAAFKRLSLNGYVSSDSWCRVMKVLRPKLPEEVIAILFQSVDPEGLGHVNSRSFLQLCSMVDVTFDERSSSSLTLWLHAKYPFIASLRETGRTLLRAKFKIFGQHLLYVQAIIMVFVVLSAVQLVKVARSNDIPEGWSIFGAVLLAIFSLEVCVKLFCLGTQEYFENGWNRLDVACMAFGIAFYVFSGIAGQHALAPSVGITRNFALAIRFLRLLRLLTLFKTCQEIIVTLSRVLPSVLRLLFVLFFLLYAYAIGGMWLYSNQLNGTNPALASLPWAQYAAELNFDDIQSAMLTLFEVANLGNWLIVFDAARAIAPVTSLHSTYTYFFTFRVVIAMIYVPIFIGFVLEAIIKNFELLDRETEKEDAEAAEADRIAELRKRQNQNQPPSSQSRNDALKQPLLDVTAGGDNTTSPGASDAAPTIAALPKSTNNADMRFSAEDFDDSVQPSVMSPPHSPKPAVLNATARAALAAAAAASSVPISSSSRASAAASIAAAAVAGAASTTTATTKPAGGTAIGISAKPAAPKRKYRIKLERTHSMIQSAMFDLGKTTEDPNRPDDAPGSPAGGGGWTSDGAGGAGGDTDSIEGEDGALVPTVDGIGVSGLVSIDEQPINLPARTGDGSAVVDFVDERRVAHPHAHKHKSGTAAGGTGSGAAAAAAARALPQPTAPIDAWGRIPSGGGGGGGGMTTHDAVLARLSTDLKSKDEAIRFKEQTIQQLASNLLRAQIDSRHTQQSLEAQNKELSTELEALKRQLNQMAGIGTPERR